MKTVFDILQQFGASSADVVWFPLLIWTCLAALVFFVLRINKSIQPLYQYHIRVATLLALPIGLVSALLLQTYSFLLNTGSGFSSQVFIVQNPLPAVTSYADSASLSSVTNWFDINFVIGLISALFVIVAGFMIIRLIISYTQLKRLHKKLSSEPLTNTQFKSGLKDGSVSLAFHNHPLVPFTFGWKNPIIVLPKKIESDPDKLNMAIQHELVHIRRGDYLLQLAVSLIQSVFWFHPLIHIGTREIETYREISCDQEVLNTSDIHPKKYANMLYELLPLNKEFGSFTVSMAVKQSTLKQRIETMKHHKMNKASYKRSLLLLLSITLLIIAPIACSDLRGPDTLSDEEILNEKMTLTEFIMEVNGKEVLKANQPGVSVSTQGLGAIAIHPDQFGLFEFSIRPFEGALQTGSISKNKIEFKINQLDVTIISSDQILKNSENATLWVNHKPNIKYSSGFTSYPDANMPPPPPPTKEQTPSDENVFVVVEKMPELEGGQKAIQSKVYYPPTAIRAGIEGRVTVQFIVDENGDVINPKVIRGIGGGCDEEALRVVSQAKFTPGKQRGRNVAVQMSLPILFKLSNSEFKQKKTSEATPRSN